MSRTPLHALSFSIRCVSSGCGAGIFRDSFVNVVELLDDLFQRAGAADEPVEMNYIRKHVTEMTAEGLENPTARLFSNPAGDYGSMVNERVGAGNWEDGDELGNTWAARNSFSYGRGGECGSVVLTPSVRSSSQQRGTSARAQIGSGEVEKRCSKATNLSSAFTCRKKERRVGSMFDEDCNPNSNLSP